MTINAKIPIRLFRCRMNQTILLMLLSLILFALLPHESEAASAKPLKIILDGQELPLAADTPVTMVDNNVMIPLRVVAENLKFKVDWNQQLRRVQIQQDSRIISLGVDQKEAIAADQQIMLNVPPQLINKTVVVPIRFVSEQMGLKVGWNNKEKIVELTSGITDPVPDDESLPVSEDNQVEPLKQVHNIQLENNQLIISMDGDVSPHIFVLANPDRIVIDLPNTTLGDVYKSLNDRMAGSLDVSTYPDISEVRYSLFKRNPDQVRIVVETINASAIQYNHQFIDNHFILDLNVNVLEQGSEPPVLEPPVLDQPVLETERKVVVIDPGHGGSDPGASGFSNRKEKDFTLALSLKVQALLLLEPGIEVIMTRDSDAYPTLADRVKLAKEFNADLFVSIHGNSVQNSPQTSGTETYYYQRISSKELAEMLHKRIIEAMGLHDRGVKEGNFHVIRETTMAAALLELGFLSNLSDEKAMFTDSVQNIVAQAIVDGIKEYLGKK